MKAKTLCVVNEFGSVPPKTLKALQEIGKEVPLGVIPSNCKVHYIETNPSNGMELRLFSNTLLEPDYFSRYDSKGDNSQPTCCGLKQKKKISTKRKNKKRKAKKVAKRKNRK